MDITKEIDELEKKRNELIKQLETEITEKTALLHRLTGETKTFPGKAGFVGKKRGRPAKEKTSEEV